jgi:hypothetical protein
LLIFFSLLNLLTQVHAQDLGDVHFCINTISQILLIFFWRHIMHTSNRNLALLLVLEAVLVTVPFFILQSVFEFPDILRQPADYALRLFVQHRSVIVPTYYVFLVSALMGLPLTFALVRYFANTNYGAAAKGNPSLTGFGVAMVVFQALGFSRWVFTIPMLADAYFAPNATEASKQALALMYDTLNRYLGMTVGEHLGFLTMGAWTLVLSWQMLRVMQSEARVSLPTSRIIAGVGYVTGLLIILSAGEHFGGASAQAFAVMNVIANTLWIFWLIALAIVMVRVPAQSRGFSPTLASAR